MLHLIVRSRNKSCKPLKDIIVPKRTILRLGSTTATKSIARQNHHNESTIYREINTAEACKISNNKILMKRRFTHGHIPTAQWCIGTGNYDKVKYLLSKWGTMIIKHKHSSKGEGIYLIKTFSEFLEWIDHIYNVLHDNPCNYIFERYYSYSREYRVHVTKNGSFLANRKMLKDDAIIRWHRHFNNTVWISENNPLFDRPSNWYDIISSCVRALKAIGLDIGCFDIKVQNSKHKNPKYIILESNSAPALGKISLPIYKDALIRMINNEF